MEKKNILKTGIVISLILLAGVLYSCRGQEPEGQIVLQEETSGQKESVDTKESESSKTKDGKQENSNGKEATESEEADRTSVNPSGQDIAENKSSGETSDSTGNTIYIHICGAVKSPDVYEVESGTRLVDVIKLAGGLTKEAAGDYVNQAAKVEDGQKVYIPTKDEVKDLETNVLISDINQLDANSTSKSEEPGSADSAASSKVNINTASAEELMTLPGIGESKAESIMTYRQEHGGFKTIEEIKNINGIKDSVYNKISDRITVN